MQNIFKRRDTKRRREDGLETLAMFQKHHFEQKNLSSQGLSRIGILMSIFA